MSWQGLLEGASRFANGVNGILYPGIGQGSDPRMQQIGRSQAMMQMGAGLLGGQNLGQAYGYGAQAGYEPIEQQRRQQYVDQAGAMHKAQMDAAQMAMADRARALAEDEAAKAVLAKIPTDITPEQRPAVLQAAAQELNRINPQLGAQLLQQANIYEDNRRAERQLAIAEANAKAEGQYRSASLGNQPADNARQAQVAQQNQRESNLRIATTREEAARARLAQRAAEELAIYDSQPGLLADPKYQKRRATAEGRYKGVTGRDYRTPQDKLYALATGGGDVAAADSGGGPPLAKLKEGTISTFANGQEWTLENGKAKRLK